MGGTFCLLHGCFLTPLFPIKADVPLTSKMLQVFQPHTMNYSHSDIACHTGLRHVVKVIKI